MTFVRCRCRYYAAAPKSESELTIRMYQSSSERRGTSELRRFVQQTYHPKLSAVANIPENKRLFQESAAEPAQVPSPIAQQNQPPAAWTTALLLSRHLIWLSGFLSIRHRRFLSLALMDQLFDALVRRSAKLLLRSDTPRNLPCSSKPVSLCTEAILGRSRHMSLSELRGIVTGNQAWSVCTATGEISCFPLSWSVSFLLPLARTSVCCRAVSRLRSTCSSS